MYDNYIGNFVSTGNSANASTVTIDEATFPDSCVRKFTQEQDVNKDGVLSDEERNIDNM